MENFFLLLKTDIALKHYMTLYKFLDKATASIIQPICMRYGSLDSSWSLEPEDDPLLLSIPPYFVSHLQPQGSTLPSFKWKTEEKSERIPIRLWPKNGHNSCYMTWKGNHSKFSKFWFKKKSEFLQIFFTFQRHILSSKNGTNF